MLIISSDCYTHTQTHVNAHTHIEKQSYKVIMYTRVGVQHPESAYKHQQMPSYWSEQVSSPRAYTIFICETWLIILPSSKNRDED